MANKFMVSTEQVKNILDAISRITNPKAVTKLLLGVDGGVSPDVVCAAKVIGGAEEVAVRFGAKASEAVTAPEGGAFKNTDLIAVFTALLALKETLCLTFSDTSLFIGVAGKASTKLDKIAEDEVPAGVALNKDDMLVHFSVKQSEFSTLLRGGGFATSSNASDQKGTNNATLVVEDGKLSLYSCDELGATVASATIPAQIEDVPVEGGTKRSLFCQEKGMPALFVPVPKKVLANMLALIDGEGTLQVIITDKVIMMTPKAGIQYLAVLGAKAFTGAPKLMEAIGALPSKGVLVVDNEKLRTSLSLIQSFIGLTSAKNSPVEVRIAQGHLVISQPSVAENKVAIELVGSQLESNDISCCLDPTKLSILVGILAKGNVRIEFKDKDHSPLLFSNGTLTEATDKVKILLAPVKKPVAEETSAASEEK